MKILIIIECKDNYYYNKVEQICKNAEGKLQNCKYGYEDKYCEKCKIGFYLICIIVIKSKVNFIITKLVMEITV